MTKEEFSRSVVERLRRASSSPQKVQEEIRAVYDQLVASNWAQQAIADYFREIANREIEGPQPLLEGVEPPSEVIKRAQSNTAFMALLAKADTLAAQSKARGGG